MAHAPESDPANRTKQSAESTIPIVERSVEERRFRKSAVLFMQEAGVKLEFPVATSSAAAVLFHRFFLKRPIAEFDRFLITTTCLYLAAKLEESPKRLRDVINTTYKVHHKAILQIGQEYWELRDAVIAHEQIVLRTLAFDLAVEYPYKYLMNYAASLRTSAPVLQAAWNIANDSYLSTTCLQHSPSVIAAASLAMAYKLMDAPMPVGRRHWLDAFGVDRSEVDVVCNEIIDVWEL